MWDHKQASVIPIQISGFLLNQVEIIHVDLRPSEQDSAHFANLNHILSLHTNTPTIKKIV